MGKDGSSHHSVSRKRQGPSLKLTSFFSKVSKDDQAALSATGPSPCTARTPEDASPEREDESPTPTGPLGASTSCNSNFELQEQRSDYKNLGRTREEAPPKFSSYGKFPWIERTSEGYKCKTCSVAFKKGPWVTELISLASSKKLGDKASKHAKCFQHKTALEASQCLSGDTVQSMLITQSQRQVEQNTGCTKNLLKLAYYLFKSEIPHTTSNWPDLVATAASVDGSGDFLRIMATKPQNAHFLSSTSITGFLEAFGEAVSAHITSKLSQDQPYCVCADECTDVNGRAVLSTFIRHISACHGSFQVEETFISAVSLETTKAEDITNTLIGELRKVGLKPEKISAVSFDGGANFSGNVSGVRARLKEYAPDLLFVHCRSHLLQLALVHSCRQTPAIKRVLSALNKLYSTFRGSHKRLTILENAQLAIEGLSHKLVQPGETRWLSYEGSVKVVVEHYSSICVALEHIYADAGDYSSDAGGLLLLFRKKSTVFILVLLARLLGPLARLSKCLQSSKGNLSEAMKLVRAVMSSLEEIRVENVRMEAQKLVEEVQENQVRMEDDETISDRDLLKIGSSYKTKVLENMHARFCDQFQELALFHDIFHSKLENPDFRGISQLCGTSEHDMVTEYSIYRRYPGELASQQALLRLACEVERKAMFPALSSAAMRILLLPVGTAAVERSFSTMNRILTSDRCRMTPAHVDALMKISIEGPSIPSIRNATDDERDVYLQFLDRAYIMWAKKPHREL